MTNKQQKQMLAMIAQAIASGAQQIEVVQHGEAPVGSPELPKALANGIAVIGKLGESLQAREDATDGERLVAQLLIEASVPGNTRAGACDLLRAHTPETREAVAGIVSALSQMSEQMLSVIGFVGAEQNDPYVTQVGCGDPDCEDCGEKEGFSFDLDRTTEDFTGDEGPIADIAKALQTKGKNRMVS